MPKKVLILLVVGVLVLPAMAANAKTNEGFLGLGAQFMWNNYQQPVLAYSNENSYIPEKDLNDFGTPNLGGHFQWGVTNQFVLTVGIDFAYFRHFIYPFHDVEATGDSTSSDKVAAHIFTIGATIGTKFYFWDPVPSEAVVYFSAGIGKYFGVAGSTDKLNRYDLDNNGAIEEAEELAYARAKSRLDNEAEMISGLSSPFVMQFALGAEFWASKAFSIGADILGIRFSYASAKADKAENFNSNEAEWSGEQRIVGLYVYSALTLNFNFSSRQKNTDSKATSADDNWNKGQDAQWQDNPGWGNPNDVPPPPPPPPPATATPPQQDGWNAPAQENPNAVPPPPPPPPPPPSY